MLDVDHRHKGHETLKVHIQPGCKCLILLSGMVVLYLMVALGELPTSSSVEQKLDIRIHIEHHTPKTKHMPLSPTSTPTLTPTLTPTPIPTHRACDNDLACGVGQSCCFGQCKLKYMRACTSAADCCDGCCSRWLPFGSRSCGCA